MTKCFSVIFKVENKSVTYRITLCFLFMFYVITLVTKIDISPIPITFYGHYESHRIVCQLNRSVDVILATKKLLSK